MVRDAVICGQEDPKIQQDIVNHENQDPTLEATLRLVEAKESEKRSEVSLNSADYAHAASAYNRGRATDKIHKLIGGQRNDESCPNCGELTHTDKDNIDKEEGM